MIDLIELGEAVRARRNSLGWTREDLATKSGASRARIESLENGRVSEIGFKMLMRIVNAVGLDLRLTDLNASRPTLEELADEEERHAPRMG